MIRIALRPLWSEVAFDDQDELDWLITEGCVRSDYNFVTGTYARTEFLLADLADNNQPGLYPSADLSIPKALLTGAVPLVVEHAKEQGFQVIVDDSRWRHFAPRVSFDFAGLPVQLREHQIDACRVALQKLHGMIKAPTGSGKTAICMGIANNVKGTNTLVLVPSPGLLKSYVEGFERCGREAGVLGDDGDLIVTTYDRAATWLKKQPGPARVYLARFGAVMADEAHACVSDGRLPVMKALVNAVVRIGLSATPFDRTDGRNLLVAAVLGPRIYEVETEELVDQGYVAKAGIMMSVFEHDSSGSAEVAIRLRWSARYSRHVVRNAERNALVLDLVERAAKPCLLFVKELEHVEILQKQLAKAGHNVRQVTGALTIRQREGLIDDLRRGRIDVVVCTKVWSTGVDIPELASVVIGGAGKAPIDVIQTIGRGMRIADGKDTFEVWDIHDAVYTALYKQAQARIRVYRGEGHEVTILGNPSSNFNEDYDGNDSDDSDSDE